MSTAGGALEASVGIQRGLHYGSVRAHVAGFMGYVADVGLLYGPILDRERLSLSLQVGPAVVFGRVKESPDACEPGSCPYRGGPLDPGTWGGRPFAAFGGIMQLKVALQIGPFGLGLAASGNVNSVKPSGTTTLLVHIEI